MGCLGVHFAITFEEVEKLKSFKDDSDRLNYLQEEIEDEYFGSHEDLLAQSDKAWDAIHRALSDGDLSYTTGPYPLRLTVIGGEPLYYETDYILSLKTPKEVKDIALALEAITKDEFYRKYDRIDQGKYGVPKTPEDRAYTWGWLIGVVNLYKTASAEGRYVLFTADQ